MVSIQDVSIKKKLVFMQVFTSVIILVLSSVAFVITDIKSYKEQKVERFNDIALVIGSNIISSIQLLDYDAAKEKLQELNVKPDILNAVILDKNGAVFASYTMRGADSVRFSLADIDNKKAEFVGNYLFVYHNIIKDNEIIGKVCLQVEANKVKDVINEKLQVAALLLVVGIAFAFLIAMFVQRSISVPLSDLANVIKKVKESGDYKSRSLVKGKDEINALSQVFNDMLEKIEKRELSLKERTAELEISIKELESFSFSVSHDLRAPIRAINGFAKIVEKKYSPQFDTEGQELLNTIVKESIRMGQLIDDLIAFARLGKKEIQKTKVDMTALAKEAVEELLKLSEKKYKAKITVTDLLPSDCDRVLMRQVFVNLISNSLKYSYPKPDPSIEIGSFSEENSIVYFVKDNGVGFDMKFYDQLYGVFQRLHDPEQFEGTGIGLSIVKRIIVRHGGRVWAEGKVNEGATFYFSLPKLSDLAQ